MLQYWKSSMALLFCIPQTNPLESYLSLIPLLRFATENIPADKHSETPLYILCTAGAWFGERRGSPLSQWEYPCYGKTHHSQTNAFLPGMRLLSEEQRNNIINIVHTKIEQEFKFYFKHNHVEVNI